MAFQADAFQDVTLAFQIITGPQAAVSDAAVTSIDAALDRTIDAADVHSLSDGSVSTIGPV